MLMNRQISENTAGKKKYFIIGLGLIGGSLAKALREKAGSGHIYASDTDKASLEAAISEGVVTGELSLAEAVSGRHRVDIIFICTPVGPCLGYIDAISEYITKAVAAKTHNSENAPRKLTFQSFPVVTDVCSTKKEITAKINSIREHAPHIAPCFVGGHPMTGSERDGYKASKSHLFENAYYILTPSSTSTAEAIALVEETVRAAGAIPVELDAEEHDRITASISHVPHIIASALVNLVKGADSEGMMQLLAAGGFRDITRIASSNPGLWRSIVCSNKGQIKDVLEILSKILREFGKNLENGDSAAIEAFFREAKLFRDSLSASEKTLIPPEYHIVADVIDKPGIIGRIASILGAGGVNIKNINVSNSREMEQGCLRITLADKGDAEASLKLLTDSGYKVYPGL